MANICFQNLYVAHGPKRRLSWQLNVLYSPRTSIKNIPKLIQYKNLTILVVKIIYIYTGVKNSGEKVSLY
jgi:hypothetical protein